MKNNKVRTKFFLSVIALLCIFLCQFVSVYAANPISLTLDGATVKCDVSPVIVNSRTLVPLRAVFEAMGAEVKWDNSTRTAHVSYKSNTVDVTINSTTAYVNGSSKKLDVPASITNGRTLIPVRFVSENLGFGVSWNSSSRTVVLTSPAQGSNTSSTVKPAGTHSITSILLSNNSSTTGSTSVTITADYSLKNTYTATQIASPDRYFVDFSDFKRGSNIKDSYTSNDAYSVVGGIRTALNTETVVRVVVDLKEASTPSVSFSSDGKTMTLTFGKYSKADQIVENSSQTFNALADGKIVVCLDPGHGKTTGGKRSPDQTLMEWEFNRDVAYRIKGYLEAHGIQTVMTVAKDDQTDPSLAKRVEIANNSAADVFVSIHANAFGSDGEWTSAKGWEIYVYRMGGYGEELAAAIEKANIPANGLNNRGMKEANFYVIKNTVMPAVLIEHGFYTNKTEVEKLKSDSFREQLAIYDSQGICNFFNISW